MVIIIYKQIIFDTRQSHTRLGVLGLILLFKTKLEKLLHIYIIVDVVAVTAVTVFFYYSCCRYYCCHRRCCCVVLLLVFFGANPTPLRT